MLMDFDTNRREMQDRFDRHSRRMFRAWLVMAAFMAVAVPGGIIALVYGVLWCLREFGVIGT